MTVYDLFTQVPGSLDRAPGGLGIGLTLVRTLVELHEGMWRRAAKVSPRQPVLDAAQRWLKSDWRRTAHAGFAGHLVKPATVDVIETLLREP